VLASFALGYLISPWFYLVTAFVGANLLQSAFTGLCPLESILRRAGVAEICGLVLRCMTSRHSRTRSSFESTASGLFVLIGPPGFPVAQALDGLTGLRRDVADAL